MSRRIVSIALLTAATALSACGGNKAATLAAVGPQSCFKTTEVTRLQPIGRDAAQILVGTRAYELRVTGVCPDLNWADRVVLSSEGDPATAATLCTGQPVTIMSPSPKGGFQECYGNELLLAPPMPVSN